MIGLLKDMEVMEAHKQGRMISTGTAHEFYYLGKPFLHSCHNYRLYTHRTAITLWPFSSHL
jgi:hypothetical protein